MLLKEIKLVEPISADVSLIATKIREIYKKHGIRIEQLSKKKEAVVVDSGAGSDHLSKAAKKRLDVLMNNQVNPDKRFALVRKMIDEDGVHDRLLLAIQDMVKELPALGVKKIGPVLATPGTKGFGGYGPSDFDMVPIKSASPDENWVEYSIVKVEI